MTSLPTKEKYGLARIFSTRRRFFYTTLLVCALLTALFSQPVFAQNQPLLATAPRSRQLIDLSQVKESWARDWDITHTAVMFPGGGQAGFYRRPPRMNSAVPHRGRLGILYLYPESDYNPARISRRHVEITQATSRSVIGVCANRVPRGEWTLRVLVDDAQIGDDVLLSGKDGWQDIAFNLSAFLGRRVDIEIEAHTSMRRAAYVYIDYIRLEDPARQPVSLLMEAGTGHRDVFNAHTQESVEEHMDNSAFFDIYYWNFLELLRDREERRRYDYMLNQSKPVYCPKRPR